MYQFTTTNVINSAYVLDYDGNQMLDSAGSAIAKYVGSTAGLDVRKVGNFKKANIVSIYKRPYAAGVKEVAQVTIPQIAAGLVARLDIVLKLSQSTQSEYTNYTLDFLKPISVEVIATNTAATDATALVAQLNSLKNRFGQSYITAAASGADVVITCKDNFQRVQSMVISKEVASPNSLIQPEYENVSSTTFSVTTAGKVGFGDDAWMQRSVMLQTLDTARPFGISKEERPILGGNYSEYVLRYNVTKDGTDGIVSGGTSVTTHVFYVKSDLVSGFEAAITAASIAVDTVALVATNVTIATASVTTAAGANGVQLVATTTPSGLTNVVYALRSAGNVDASGSGADFTKVTITPGGILTFASGHGIVATDTIGLTVSVDGLVKDTTVVMTA